MHYALMRYAKVRAAIFKVPFHETPKSREKSERGLFSFAYQI